MEFFNFIDNYKKRLSGISKVFTATANEPKVTADPLLVEFCRALSKLVVITELLEHKKYINYELSLYKKFAYFYMRVKYY